MNGISKPPPQPSMLAAAGGGFVGALAGALVAASIMGNGDDSDSQSRIDHADDDKPAIVAER